MILIIDDDITILTSLRILLTRAGYEVRAVGSPTEAIDVVRHTAPEAILMDMNFTRATSGEEGLTLLRQVRIFRPDVPVILMTAWGSIDLAVAGMRLGAFDFITKPWDNRRLLERVKTAVELSEKSEDPEKPENFEGIIGTDPALREVLRLVDRVASTDASVLITGESGTGKELIAEAIHRRSRRASAPFVKVNLGGMPASLFESEMFGHKKGAFTGAVADRTGRFEAADGGTIFLDEIGELDLSSQVKMLRVLQEQRFEPLGSSRTRKVDVRVVCATNADLPAMVTAHTFREDLFYRINLVTLRLPPLRERRGDIGPLARHFAARFTASQGIRETVEITPDAVDYLATLPFPGNIRELKNLVERTILLSSSGRLDVEAFRSAAGAQADKHPEHSDSTLQGVERERIVAALAAARGNISQAASALGISRPALYRRIEKYKIEL